MNRARNASTNASINDTASSPRSVEWPTWLLIGVVYGSWLAALVWYAHGGAWGALLALVVVSAWYMSLQHELVHNHPSCWPPVKSS